MTETSLLPVEPVDREAAAKLYEWFPSLSSCHEAAMKTAVLIRGGGADGWTTVQMFRAHRLAERDRTEKALRDFCDEHGPSGGAWNISMVLGAIAPEPPATAIRSPSLEEG